MSARKRQGNTPQEQNLTPAKTIRIALSGDVLITETERLIIDTPAFQRLRRIKQLGTSYLVFPSATHTRFEHSLGTLKIADLMVQKIRDSAKIQEAKRKEKPITIDESDRQIIRLVALLHDITQIPFGHTLEDESHVISPDHDSDEERFQYFLGEKSPIGRILLDKIGLEKYDLLLSVLKTKRADIESLGDKAYISDIAKNTVCADLLDYLRRDAYYCNLNLDFGDRFLNFLFLAYEKSKKPNGKNTVRLVIRVWKDEEKKHRRDLIDELIQLLNCRFFLGSAVYFHHAKVITSAMISRTVKQALNSGTVKKEQLWKMGDDQLLHWLSESKDPVTKHLAESLLNRTLYKGFYEFSYAEAIAEQSVELLDILEKELNKDCDNRTREENELSNILEDLEEKEGGVLIYCPEKKMQLKMAEMLVLWKQQHKPLNEVTNPLIKQKIESIHESHRQLWSIKVVVSPKLTHQLDKEKSKLLTAACENLVPRYIEKHSKAYHQLQMSLRTEAEKNTNQIVESSEKI